MNIDPEDYSVDKHSVAHKLYPVSSNYGTVEYQVVEEIHDKTLVQMTDPSGATKTVVKKSLRKRFH